MIRVLIIWKFRISGTVGAVITNPLEVVKTRMQSSLFHNLPHQISLATSSPLGGSSSSTATAALRVVAPLRMAWMHILGTVDVLRSIYTSEGLSALWRGMGPTIVGVMPSRAIYFSTYSSAKHLLMGVNGGVESSWIHLSSALAAGIATSTATNPIWLVKTRMQLQCSTPTNAATISSTPIYRNSWHCLRVILRTEGVGGLYRGLTASYLGTLEGTIQWVLYEKLKKSVARRRQQQLGKSISSSSYSMSNLTWTDFFLTAATAKLVAAVIAYPHEVIRTRLREDGSQYRGLWRTTMRIVKEEGVRGFYGGMTAHLMRVVPNSAIMFFCYECIVHGYSRWSSSSDDQSE